MTTKTHAHAIVGTYDNQVTAQAAIQSLQDGGCDMTDLSVIGRGDGTKEQVFGFVATGDRIQVWGKNGILWGNLWGRLTGGAFLFLPLLGPLVVLGPLAAILIQSLDRAVVGTEGAFTDALGRLGIPKESALAYELDLKLGRYLLLSDGTADSVARAQALLAPTGAIQVAVHHSETTTSQDTATFVTKESILQMLSDTEVSKVSSTEATHHLADGEEFLDLGRLDRGVLRAPFDEAPMGQILPRNAMLEGTWKNVLLRLTALPDPAQAPTV